MRILPCGRDAALIELDDAHSRRALVAALADDPIAGIVETVPAARTVLIRWAPESDAQGIVDTIRRLPLSAISSGDITRSDALTIPVTYDGPDLADVAAHVGCSPDEVITRHTGQVWTVEFVGFAPGFGYLVGDGGGLEVPRRASPRTRVPAGAVALAGPYAGVYPSASSGGWQLIGSTTAAMWDVTRSEPALFTPGRQVRFVEAASS